MIFFIRKGAVMSTEKVILMLSGGRDSFLAACRLLEKSPDYYLLMATYDNGCSYCSDKAKIVAERIIAKYGANRAKYLGVYNISSVIREFFSPYFNMKPEEQAEKFDGLTPSQFHCLICRTSMYIYSIWLAMLNGAGYIAEGGREDQEFVIELPGMARERFPALVKSAGLDLLLPVYEMNDNWVRDNELLARGFLCKSYEPKCLIGYPINQSVDQSVINGVHLYFDQIILPRINSRDLLSPDKAKVYIGNGYNEFVSE